MLDWLETTSIAHMVQESTWGYPIVLSCHAVGMGILVGIVLMINFRILGLGATIPLRALRPMFQVALVGLVINVISGTMLFMANANQFYESDPFRIKIALLIVGAVLLSVTPRLVFRGDADASAATPLSARLLAFISIPVWVGVIVAGRLIAYIDTGFY